MFGFLILKISMENHKVIVRYIYFKQLEVF